MNNWEGCGQQQHSGISTMEVVMQAVRPLAAGEIVAKPILGRSSEQIKCAVATQGCCCCRAAAEIQFPGFCSVNQLGIQGEREHVTEASTHAGSVHDGRNAVDQLQTCRCSLKTLRGGEHLRRPNSFCTALSGHICHIAVEFVQCRGIWAYWTRAAR